MDLLAVKGRVALAFVESIFRRAGFTLAPVPARESPPRRGREDVVPHFLVGRPSAAVAPGAAARRPVEVRYRPQVAQYVAIEDQRGPQSLFTAARRQWPGLLFVFVTDRPEPGRSAFQALDIETWRAGEPAVAVDLHAHPGLDVYRQNVEEHEILVRRVFALVSGAD